MKWSMSILICLPIVDSFGRIDTMDEVGRERETEMWNQWLWRHLDRESRCNRKRVRKGGKEEGCSFHSKQRIEWLFDGSIIFFMSFPLYIACSFLQFLSFLFMYYSCACGIHPDEIGNTKGSMTQSLLLQGPASSTQTGISPSPASKTLRRNSLFPQDHSPGLLPSRWFKQSPFAPFRSNTENPHLIRIVYSSDADVEIT